MNIIQQKDKLLDFLYELPSAVQAKLDAGGIDIIMLLHDIGGARGLIIGEIWWLYEGTRQILAGEASATTLPDFIKPNLEEENQPNAGVIADDIQKKILDKVVSIFKEAGLTVKEGRVPTPPPPPAPKPVLSAVVVPMSALQPMRGPEEQTTYNRQQTTGTTTPNPSLERRGGEMDEKNIRALTRIASGTTYTEQKLREAFEDLPQGLRQAISSVDTANTIQTIAKKYFLHVDQMASLASETGLVLLGLTHPADFIANLAKRLRAPEDRAKEIAREISGQILGKVREALRGLHEEPTIPNSGNSSFVKGGARVGEGGGFVNPSLPQKAGLPFPPKADPSFGGRKGELPQPQSFTPPSKLSVLSNQAETAPLQKVNTPYGVSANWKTESNTPPVSSPLKRGGGEEAPSREEVMRGIENPQSIRPTTNNQPSSAQGYGRAQQPTTERVGPTGWRPPAADGRKSQFLISNFQGSQTAFPKYPINKLETVSPKPSAPSAPQTAQRPVAEVRVPLSAQPSSAPVKVKPVSESTTTPPISSPQKRGGGGEETFLDQKLEAPMSIPKEETRYTSDPYREPLN